MDLELRRAEFIRYASSKRTRISESTPECPCEWRPHTVVDPRTGDMFTDAGAWDFVIDCLNGGCPIEEIELERPRGKKGYVLKLAGGAGRPLIYVKLQPGSGRVLGRSFHYDNYDRQAG